MRTSCKWSWNSTRRKNETRYFVSAWIHRYWPVDKSVWHCIFW